MKKFLSNQTYNVLKWIGITALPALVVFYGVVGTTLNLPYTEQVMIISTAFVTLWNTLLGVSSIQYHKDK